MRNVCETRELASEGHFECMSRYSIAVDGGDCHEDHVGGGGGEKSINLNSRLKYTFL